MAVRVMVRRFAGSRWLLAGVTSWIPLGVGLAVLALIVYAAVQQDIRQSANDPQIELAESAAVLLSAGEPAQTVLPATGVDPSTSLAPFIIVYDQAGGVRASSASLHGRTPSLPGGVLESLAPHAGSSSAFDQVGRVVLAALHLEKPRLPSGVFGSVAEDGEARFTWQPEPRVRIASVVTSYNGRSSGFVLAGRSMREIERLEDHILLLIGLGLVLGLAATLGTAIAMQAVTGFASR